MNNKSNGLLALSIAQGTGYGQMNGWDKNASPGPVKHIKPPTTSEPVELSTIVAILLRKHYKLYGDHMKDPDKKFLCTLYFAIRTRKLTAEESKRALALLTWYRSR